MTQDTVADRVIADTNAFLHFINNDPALTEAAREVLESDIRVMLSSASIWEIAIKVSTGKLTLPDTFGNFIPLHIRANRIEIISPGLDDYQQVSSLPFHHKDPFDRLIVAQALIGELAVVSSDEHLDLYGIRRIW